jgi:hypothetical protein
MFGAIANNIFSKATQEKDNKQNDDKQRNNNKLSKKQTEMIDQINKVNEIQNDDSVIKRLKNIEDKLTYLQNNCYNKSNQKTKLGGFKENCNLNMVLLVLVLIVFLIY